MAGLIAAQTNDGIGIAGPRATGGAPGREGRRAAALDPGRGRGEGDPLGGRERRAGHQHEPRRAPRPGDPDRDTLLAARGGRRRLRGRRRAFSSSQRSATPTSRRRSRGRTRAGRRRCRTCSASARSAAGAARPAFSNRDAQFNDIAAPGEDILSTFPLRADGRAPGLRRAGVLELRPGGVPRRPRARASPRRR